MYARCLEKLFFWILVTNLPKYYYTMEVGQKMASMFDSCQTLQIMEDRTLGTKFFRISVLVNITKALKRLLRMAMPDGGSHVDLRDC